MSETPKPIQCCPHYTTHAPEWAGQLDAYDFNDSGIVLVMFSDGSVAVAADAFYRIEGPEPSPRLVVYTEHCGYWVFLHHTVSGITGWHRQEKEPDDG